MSLQVNFTTHGKDLRVTYEDILNSTSGNDWAMFGYDKGTNDLKVLGTGNGGLEELEDEFADGKIQYAFARVVDPNSSLNKFVLIGWCGDGVPESKKGLFNTHLADVARFLKGYHLQINARSEADVTPQQIMKRIDEASASKYSYHKETSKGRDLIAPLQSAYKRTEVPDIASMQRSAAKPEPAPALQSAYKKTEIPDIAAMQRGATKPEAAPKHSFGASSTPAESSISSSSTPVTSRWNPPAASSSSSTTPPVSSSTPSWRTGGGSSYVPSSTNSFNRVAPPSSLSSYTVERNEPTMNKAAQMRAEREQREREERARIEQEIKAREARERESDQQSTANKVAEERRLQEEREREAEARRIREQDARQQRERDEQERKDRERREAEEAEKSARAAREAAKAREQGEIEAARERARKLEEEREEAERAAAAASTAATTVAAAEAEAKKREEEDERRRLQQEAAEARRIAEEEERARREAQEAEEQRRRQQEQEEEERRLQEEVQAATAQSVNLGADALIASSEHPERAAGQTKTAVVLYSYESAEANEMSLVEGEIIYNVSELDVGWWSGESEDGARSGLFPANYVELIEHQPVPNGGDHDAVAAHEEDHHHAAAEGVSPVAGAAAASDKPTALALYDYVAGEPNEISFNEGETITDIEQVTDDWWQGMNQKGDIGLFPANYVELHQ